jgi:hypothetical protein
VFSSPTVSFAQTTSVFKPFEMRCFSVLPYVATVVSNSSILSSHWSLLYRLLWSCCVHRCVQNDGRVSRCKGDRQVTAAVVRMEVMFQSCDISLYSKAPRATLWVRMLWLQIVLILPVGGSDNCSLSVVTFRKLKKKGGSASELCRPRGRRLLAN